MVVEYHGNLEHKVTKTDENGHIRGSKYTQTYMRRFKHEKSNLPGRKSDQFLPDICHQVKPSSEDCQCYQESRLSMRTTTMGDKRRKTKGRKSPDRKWNNSAKTLDNITKLKKERIQNGCDLPHKSGGDREKILI